MLEGRIVLTSSFTLIVCRNAADRVVSGEGKFEELMAASQEVAASTAQLVVASKVKADRGSERMSALSKASKGVTTATAGVLGTVKTGKEVLEDKGNWW